MLLFLSSTLQTSAFRLLKYHITDDGDGAECLCSKRLTAIFHLYLPLRSQTVVFAVATCTILHKSLLLQFPYMYLPPRAPGRRAPINNVPMYFALTLVESREFAILTKIPFNSHRRSRRAGERVKRRQAAAAAIPNHIFLHLPTATKRASRLIMIFIIVTKRLSAQRYGYGGVYGRNSPRIVRCFGEKLWQRKSLWSFPLRLAQKVPGVDFVLEKSIFPHF